MIQSPRLQSDFYEFVRRLPTPCAILSPERGIRIVNGVRVSFREGKRVLVNYRQYNDDPKGTGWLVSDSNEVLIEEFVEWCLPDVELIGGDGRSCHLPM